MVSQGVVVPLVDWDMTIGFVLRYNGSHQSSIENLLSLERVARYLSPILGRRLRQELSESEGLKARTDFANSEERLRVALKKSPIILTHQDRNLRYTWTYNLDSHLSLEQPIGKTDFDLLPHDDAIAFTRLKQEVMSQGISKRRALPVHIGDRVFHYDVNVEPLIDETGIVRGVTTAATDITALKQIAATLERTRRMEYAGQLAGQIAHDFNNLLGPLVGYPELIRMQGSLTNKARQMLDDIETVAGQMASISQDLLTLGRRGHCNFESMDLTGIINCALRTIDLPDSIKVNQDSPIGLPNLCGGSGQMLRVFANLISNAADAMNGSGTITISIDTVTRAFAESLYQPDKSAEYKQYVRVSIRDSGPGIPEDVRDRIFEPFYSTKRADKKRGSGLGLSVVKTVVEDHKGFIEIDTEIGFGTAFHVHLPVWTDPLPDAVTVQDGAIPRGNREMVLVADEDDVQLRLLGHFLELLNYQVTSVSNVEGLFRELHSNTFDVVIVDLTLGHDGVCTALKRIREARPEQPILVASGLPQNDRVLKALKISAREFLAKPADLSTLASALRSALRGHRSTLPVNEMEEV
jgi:signal transduction histidine kinase/ActR/RegA family two-component response regulator